MQKTLLEYVSKYTPNEKHNNILAKSFDCKCSVSKEKRILHFHVSFSEYVHNYLLWEIEDEIKKVYQLNVVKIFPFFPTVKFSEKYLYDILQEAQKQGAVSKGFLSKYEYKIYDKTIVLNIPFSYGAVDLLYNANTNSLVSKIINEEFGETYDVKISSGDYDEKYYDQKFEDELKNYQLDNNIGLSQEKYKINKSNSIYGDNEINIEILNDNIIKIGKMVFNLNNSELIYGDDFEINPIPLRNINISLNEVTVLGKVFKIDEKETKKGGKSIFEVSLTDGDSSILLKKIINTDDEIKKCIKIGDALCVKGKISENKFDNELEMSIDSIYKIKIDQRMDNANEKRVELHLHTQLSAMDAIITPDEAVNIPFLWGHRAVAITDHGNVQAFPEVMLAYEKIMKNHEGDSDVPFKILYGMEGYLVDDTARTVFGNSNEKLDGKYVVFDIETTGLNPLSSKIIEIGAVKINNGIIESKFDIFLNPNEKLSDFTTELTGITDDMVLNGYLQLDGVKEFLSFAGDSVLIAHNANFDISFIRKVCDDNEIIFENTYIDTLAMSRYVNQDLNNHKLDKIVDYYKLGNFNHHRASDDAEILALVFFKMIEKLKEEGIRDIHEMNRIMSDKVDPLKLRTYHIVLLVKNLDGLTNLYKLVSMGYLKYYKRHPRIPKTILQQYRDGLIIGSACSEGQLFNSILENKPRDEIIEIAKFYDYLEVQPLENDAYLVDSQRVENYDSIKILNKKIIELGDELNIPVVATSDAHFINKEDEIYRKILLTGIKMKDADKDVNLYLKTTEEMLNEFSYLPKEKAYEIVVKNTNIIADQIDVIRPIPKGNYAPKMEGAEEDLQKICYETAKNKYGDPLPDIVASRLDKELTSIISNGYAVLYMIAQKLVSYSESQGYLVGSRGSVGSSFVASMSGISEVNPLPPHYYCPNCKYSEFITDSSIGSGFDLPDKKCPMCNTDMKGDGHDIPFETFLGFNGDKCPDIDLNFSGEVQGKVHKYTEELFGSENVFRAGTLGTIAEKTAYGFVLKYLESKNISVNKAEINRLVSGCVGVKRTTGQHPGGIIVVPREYDVYKFTPVQHPADDDGSNIITTHFAFEFLHDTILKLDELGHDVPTKYKMIEKFSNTNVMNVPMNDPDVYELFKSTKSLGIRPEDIDCQIGTFGMPEMGTRFIQQVLIDAKPKNFADLLQISGLTHGTNVWLGNAQDLIKNGICDISQVIGTRDGIMLDLIRYGLDKGLSFKIMEDVRKGRGLKPEYEEAMLDCNVPQWYIDSCKKIKYMFPKAHAAAYVMSAIRLGWYKVHMPLEFYAGFFSAAPGGFDGEIAMKGKSFVVKTIKEIREKGNEATQKEQSMISTLNLINECYARNIKFLGVNFHKSSANEYLPENGCIRLPFNCLPGVGTNAALKIASARDNDNIESVDELRQKAQLSKSVIEVLNQNHVFDDLQKTNQISFF